VSEQIDEMNERLQSPSAKSGGFHHLLSRLRSYFVWDPLIWSYTIVLGTVSLICSLFDQDGEIQHKIARLWARMILATVGSKVSLEGFDHIDTSKASVYVVNHLSALDIPVLYACLPFHFRILAKKELFRYPFMGWHLKRSGQIPVVLENPIEAIRSLNHAVTAVRNNMPLVIFPEGGRSRDGQLQKFMGGAFYAAIKAQVDVVPLVLLGTFEMLRMNTFHMMPHPIRLIVTGPIPTTGLTTRDTEAISGKARQEIGKIYYANAAVPDLRDVNQAAELPK
jgi:1-acyl-sn-glycerol-3-phosphate acyltransferase